MFGVLLPHLPLPACPPPLPPSCCLKRECSTSAPRSCADGTPLALPLAEALATHYRRAMELEGDFFGAQPYRPPQRTISLLVVDL